MSDLVPGSRAANGSSHAPAGPVPVPTHSPSGMRTPTDVMRARQERIQRQAEEEEIKRLRQAQAEERQRAAERRAGGGRARDSGYKSADVTPAIPYQTPSLPSKPPRVSSLGPSTYLSPRDPLSSSFAPAALAAQTAGIASASPQPAPQPRTFHAQPTQPKPLQPQAQTARQRVSSAPQQGQQIPASAQPSQAAPGPSVLSSGGVNGSAGQTRSSNNSTFPHAFERWETLSSHWEGLTSYWIRRMEQHNEEIRRDPISQQMSRQITDLSAAGANLFHAVVELQRLRASSERKFQRWFFETRAEQERAQETQAELTAALEEERIKSSQGAAARQAPINVQQNIDNDRRLLEMKRELQISRDECRRAWEELGRREQLERDRVFSLKQGHAIDIGGVQVLPQGSTTRTASGQMQTQSYQTQGGHGQQSLPGQAYGDYEQQRGSPTSTDPFSGSERPRQTQDVQHSAYQRTLTEEERAGAADAQPQASRAQQTFLAERSPPRAAAQAFDPQEQYAHPERRHPIPGTTIDMGHSGLSDEDSEEDDAYRQGQQQQRRAVAPQHPAAAPSPLHKRVASSQSPDLTEDLQREQIRAAAFGRASSTTNVPRTDSSAQEDLPISYMPHGPHHEGQAQTREPADYARSGWDEEDGDVEGESWGEGPQASTHHHPTRLSDVLEEDERSRTSIGGGSRGSGGITGIY